MSAASRCGLFGVALWASAMAVGIARVQSLPEGRGRVEFESLCGRCHGLERATELRRSADQWAVVVDSMADRGIEATEDDLKRVVAYLAANFGPDTPAPSSKVNVNTAAQTELVEALGLVGSDAEGIVRYRDSQGPFKDWSDLRKVPGIDIQKLEAQKDRIEFSRPPTTAETGRDDGK